jgi:predicted RNA binding protein YcfA (HicA-like mRNA interferase family)
VPKLPVVSARECIDALEKVGFSISRQRGSHITLHRTDPPGRVTIPNHQEIKRGTLKRILNDAGLTTQEFHNLLER